MRPIHIQFSMSVADADGICVSQKPTVAANLTIAGDHASGGVATMPVATSGSNQVDPIPRHVSITSASDESGDTFTITGTDRWNNALSEEIAGPGATTVTTTANFKTVTQVATDGAATGNITVGSADEADTVLIVTDSYSEPITYAVDLSASADLTSEFKYTVSDVFDESFSAETANYIADLGASNGDYDGTSSGPITGCRFEITNWTSTDDIVNIHVLTAAH